MSDPATQLALVEAAIDARLSGNAVEETSEGTQRYRMTSLKELYEIRRLLMNEVSGGIGFSSVVPTGRIGSTGDGGNPYCY